MNVRDKNLDLIRAAALLLVIATHFLDNTGLYEAYIEWPARLTAGAIRQISVCSVALFLMLTGYLHDGRRLSPRYYLGYLRIYETYLLCCALTFLIRRTVQHEPTGLAYMVGSTINFYGCYYAWYLMMYTGLFLMIPFLNLAFDGLDGKRAHLALLASFFALSILPSILNNHVQLWSVWWKDLFPITYYYTGLFLRRYRPRIPARRAALGLLLMLALFLAIERLRFGRTDDWVIGFSWFDRYETCFLSIAVFVWLLNVRLDGAPGFLLRLTEKVSALSLSAYLMSGIVDQIVYPMFKRAYPVTERTLLLLLPMVLLVSAASLLLAQLVAWAYKPLDRIVRGWLLRRFPALRSDG